MCDFREAKDMARALLDALKSKAIEITRAEALELIAKAFGVADWNTLAATIRREASGPREDASSHRCPGVILENLNDTAPIPR